MLPRHLIAYVGSSDGTRVTKVLFSKHIYTLSRLSGWEVKLNSKSEIPHMLLKGTSSVACIYKLNFSAFNFLVQLGFVSHACNPSTWEAEAGGLPRVKGQKTTKQAKVPNRVTILILFFGILFQLTLYWFLSFP